MSFVITAVAAVTYTVYSGERAASAQKAAQSQALAQAKTQADLADQANNAANKKKPNVGALLEANQAAAGSAGSTMLTGPSGVAGSSLTLGKSTLLGA